MRNNAFLNSLFAPLLNGNATGGYLVFRSNFVNRFGVSYPSAHAELYSPNGKGTQSLNDFSFNALIGATGVQGTGSQPLPTGLTFFHTISVTKIDGNVNVNGFVGGTPRGITAATLCVGGLPPTGTTCDTTTPGGNIYVTSITAPGVPNPVIGTGIYTLQSGGCAGLFFALANLGKRHNIIGNWWRVYRGGRRSLRGRSGCACSLRSDGIDRSRGRWCAWRSHRGNAWNSCPSDRICTDCWGIVIYDHRGCVWG